ncbi:hypothetical protein [Nocardioides iriomotensis]|uniref:hypothetical protein n=1 Tax=Nocardioides iriomotensis TaxID=715784 RepID=UPI0013EC4F0A|nr:hypothetical protein [Nocardioides iriomotensis]
MGFSDTQCVTAPTAVHFFQLARVRLADGRLLTVDRCRHCGALSNDPGVAVTAYLD